MMKVLFLVVGLLAFLGCGQPAQDKEVTVTLKDYEVSSQEENKIQEIEQRIVEQDKKIDHLLFMLSEIQDGKINPETIQDKS